MGPVPARVRSGAGAAAGDRVRSRGGAAEPDRRNRARVFRAAGGDEPAAQRSRETLVNREESLRIEKLRFEGGESDEFTFRRVEAEVAAAARLDATVRARSGAPRERARRAARSQSARDGRQRVAAADERCGVRTDAAAGPAVRACSSGGPTSAPPRRSSRPPRPTSVSRAPQLFPSISLTGAFGSASLELEDLFSAPNEAWSAAGAILQPVFQGGRLRANVRRADAVREQRRAEYARTVQVAFREVLDALQGQSSLQAIETLGDAGRPALGRATELAELRYREGDISYLELLDVRRDYYQTQIDLIAAQRDALTNTVDLALALGADIGDCRSASASRSAVGRGSPERAQSVERPPVGRVRRRSIGTAPPPVSLRRSARLSCAASSSDCMRGLRAVDEVDDLGAVGRVRDQVSPAPRRLRSRQGNRAGSDARRLRP